MQNKTISRRSVSKGLAWSVPAVAVVSAAPAFAASPLPCVNVEYGDAIKYPGNSTMVRQGYGFEITITNNTKETVRVSAGTATVEFAKKTARGTVELWTADPCKGGVLLDSNSDLLVLGAGESRTLFLVVRDTGNSANEAGCIRANLLVRLAGQSVGSEENICPQTDEFGPCFTETPPTAEC